MTKRYRLIVILLLLGAVATVAWLRLNDAQGADRPAVLTAPVNRGTIEQTVLAEGIVKPLRMVAVGAQASGRITAVHVGVGQQVRQGDLIAEIDSVTQTNALRNAEASRAHARAQPATAQAPARPAERA